MDYTITRIEEERLPLSVGAGNGFFCAAMIALLVIGIVFLVIMYVKCCRKYQSRIKQLDETKQVYMGYRITKLRKTLAELEMKKLEELENL